MSGSCIARFCKISLALALLGAVAERADAQRSREVQLLVTARSSGESILSIVPRVEGVTIDVLGADGQATLVGTGGVRVLRTTGGMEISAPVRLRLRSGNPAVTFMP